MCIRDRCATVRSGAILESRFTRLWTGAVLGGNRLGREQGSDPILSFDWKNSGWMLEAPGVSLFLRQRTRTPWTSNGMPNADFARPPPGYGKKLSAMDNAPKRRVATNRWPNSVLVPSGRGEGNNILQRDHFRVNSVQWRADCKPTHPLQTNDTKSGGDGGGTKREINSDSGSCWDTASEDGPIPIPGETHDLGTDSISFGREDEDQASTSVKVRAMELGGYGAVGATPTHPRGSGSNSGDVFGRFVDSMLQAAEDMEEKREKGSDEWPSPSESEGGDWVTVDRRKKSKSNKKRSPRPGSSPAGLPWGEDHPLWNGPVSSASSSSGSDWDDLGINEFKLKITEVRSLAGLESAAREAAL